jgi:hypothetical protein
MTGGIIRTAQLGRTATFTPDQEQKLTEHVMGIAKLLYGINTHRASPIRALFRRKTYVS